MYRPLKLAREAGYHLRNGGVSAVREFAWRTALRYGVNVSPPPVLNADWDLLVVLDACRADLWASVVGDDGRFPVGTSRVAAGGTSSEWLDAVFDTGRPEKLRRLGYVTGNPYSADHVDGDALAYLEEVWRYAWDEEVGTVRPRSVTDAAIRAARDGAAERLIVHYMQPHFPSLAETPGDGMAAEAWGGRSLSVWDDIRFGRRDPEDAWASYRENLQLVLDDVELLLSNVDAERVVLTADHGNAFGERGIYGHAAGIALLALREVPWAVTDATDSRTHEPATRPGPSGRDTDVADRLADLGYR